MLLRQYDLGGSGPVLLLVHATSLHGRTFTGMVQQALAASFRCIAVDLPGHGDSPALSEEEAANLAQAMTDSLYETICHLGLQGCWALGHSLGGTLLLRTESLHPGTFAAIYVFESPALTVSNQHTILKQEADAGITPPGHQLAALARKRRWHWPSRDEAHRAMAGRPPFNLWHPQVLRSYVKDGTKPLAATSVATPSAPAQLDHRAASAAAAPLDGQPVLSALECSSRAFTSSSQSGPQQQALPPQGVQLCCNPSTEEATYLACEPPPAFDACRVQCPVAWAITGSDPGLHSRLPALGRAAQQELQHAALREFPHLSHFGPQEAPAAVGNDALLFFRQVAAGHNVFNSVDLCIPDGPAAQRAKL